MSNVYLVFTPENHLLWAKTDLEDAKRTAKVIDGYIVAIYITHDYRKVIP